MNSVRNLLQVAVVAAGISLVATLPAHAGVTFEVANDPQPGEENILLNTGTSGSFTIGHTNMSGLAVLFSSTTDTIMDPPMGQARIVAQDDLLNDLTITLPGGYYEDLILNPKDGTDTAHVSVLVDGNLVPYTFDYSLGMGENFLTLYATGGDKIVSTTIDSAAGFGDLRQPRISGAALFTTPVVPEPCSMALLAAGALPLIGRLRRRQA